MTDPHLLDLAQALLRKNDAGPFTKPGPSQYPHQWNWDSALIALGLSHFDLPRALTEIRCHYQQIKTSKFSITHLAQNKLQRNDMIPSNP